MTTSVRKGFVYVNIILVNKIWVNCFNIIKIINLKKKKKKSSKNQIQILFQILQILIKFYKQNSEELL